jgi:hypothetical protein
MEHGCSWVGKKCSVTVSIGKRRPKGSAPLSSPHPFCLQPFFTFPLESYAYCTRIGGKHWRGNSILVSVRPLGSSLALLLMNYETLDKCFNFYVSQKPHMYNENGIYTIYGSVFLNHGPLPIFYMVTQYVYMSCVHTYKQTSTVTNIMERSASQNSGYHCYVWCVMIYSILFYYM